MENQDADLLRKLFKFILELGWPSTKNILKSTRIFDQGQESAAKVWPNFQTLGQKWGGDL